MPRRDPRRLLLGDERVPPRRPQLLDDDRVRRARRYLPPDATPAQRDALTGAVRAAEAAGLACLSAVQLAADYRRHAEEDPATAAAHHARLRLVQNAQRTLDELLALYGDESGAHGDPRPWLRSRPKERRHLRAARDLLAAAQQETAARTSYLGFLLTIGGAIARQHGRGNPLARHAKGARAALVDHLRHDLGADPGIAAEIAALLLAAFGFTRSQS